MLGFIFRMKTESSSTQQGYGLVAGLRTSTLYVGEDLAQQIGKDLQHYHRSVHDKIHVPTFTVAASKVLYFAQNDMARDIEAQLQGSYIQLSQPAKTLAKLDKIEAGLLSQRLQNLSNSGLVQGPGKVSVQTVPMYYGLETFRTNMNASVGWSTFYAVMTSVADVLRVYPDRDSARDSR
jgi:hypothetical protein